MKEKENTPTQRIKALQRELVNAPMQKEAPILRLGEARTASAYLASLADRLYFANPLDVTSRYTEDVLNLVRAATEAKNILHRLTCELNLDKYSIEELDALAKPPRIRE